MKKNKLTILAISLLSLSLINGCTGDERFPRSFTVNFVTGEGAQNIDSVVVKEGYTINDIVTPSKADSLFKGWYTLDADNVEVPFDIETYRVFENTTLYAKWTLLSTQPQEIKLGDDAFTRSLTWVQKDISSEADIKVQAYLGKLTYDYAYDENYDKNLVSGTRVEYNTNNLIDVPGKVSISNDYEITYTVDDPSTNYYWFVISSASDSFEKGEIKDVRFKGNGSKEKPYLVYTETDLKYLTTNSFDENTYAEIKNDITIMSLYSEKSTCTFNGHLTGNKSNDLIKTDENYTVTLKNNSGLFHILGEKAVVENLTLNGSIYGANPSLGVVANYNYGTIRKVNSKAVSINSQGGKVNDITTLSEGGAGGIVGTNYGLITDCTVSSVRDNVIQGHIGVGGIAGINYGLITDMQVDAIIGAYNGNEISLTINNSFAGAVVGVNYGEVSYIDVYNGKVNCRRLDDGAEGEGATNIGGVVGYNAKGGLIHNCLFDGMRCVGDTNVGGIAGYNDGTIRACYTGRRLRKPSNTTQEERQFISPVTGSYNVGGICGKIGPNSVIIHVFSTANVWAYKTNAYTIAEKADYAVGVMYNQNKRTGGTWLALKYGEVKSDTLVKPEGRVLIIDNSAMVGRTSNHALGYVYNANGEYVPSKSLVEKCLQVLGSEFGFRESTSHGIRLAWENSVDPLAELDMSKWED